MAQSPDQAAADPPIVPDLGLPVPARREVDALLIAAVSVGGVLGAEARYGLSRAWPHTAAEFPWASVVINSTGCLLIGVLMVVITELLTPHRLVRPVLGVGVLGGFTTFSTASVDTVVLLEAHRPATAAGYVALTVAGALGAVWLAVAGTRAAIRRSGPRQVPG